MWWWLSPPPPSSPFPVSSLKQEASLERRCRGRRRYVPRGEPPLVARPWPRGVVGRGGGVSRPYK